MNYRLYLDPGVHRTYMDLPEPVRSKLSRVLVDALVDPFAATEPYGPFDDGVMRLWAAGDLALVLMVGMETKTVTVLSISWAALEE